jgi:hypothetical protein
MLFQCTKSLEEQTPLYVERLLVAYVFVCSCIFVSRDAVLTVAEDMPILSTHVTANVSSMSFRSYSNGC